VAAVDANDPDWPIASFSSRGPTYCTPGGGAAIKPDIAAPGVDVRSSVPGGGYAYLSGTSMASPHVNGVVALMRQANPNISVNEIKQIIYDTAYDLGGAGEDNDYGWGMIDAYEAVMAVSGGFGTLQGTVTDIYADPINGAEVFADDGSGHTGTAYTNSSGFYTMQLQPGTYTVAYDHPNYYELVIPGVVVIEDQITTQDAVLEEDTTEVPTLSEWGMIIMALLLLAVGTVAVVRRRKAALSGAA
jgi:subtilisin family serine protease